eukprot:1984706-Amphidinium_carterae.1
MAHSSHELWAMHRSRDGSRPLVRAADRSFSTEEPWREVVALVYVDMRQLAMHRSELCGSLLKCSALAQWVSSTRPADVQSTECYEASSFHGASGISNRQSSSGATPTQEVGSSAAECVRLRSLCFQGARVTLLVGRRVNCEMQSENVLIAWPCRLGAAPGP